MSRRHLCSNMVDGITMFSRLFLWSYLHSFLLSQGVHLSTTLRPVTLRAGLGHVNQRPERINFDSTVSLPFSSSVHGLGSAQQLGASTRGEGLNLRPCRD
ncbi:uncharacterized protein BDW47DRAFT_101036 [Aspergillus candidus]|uniref:Uncharacterized protein n=1 Tax=Aspergillus candidus TaxID=41067 RepID=A0A2I2FID8_ASPCN|nr:hypothetical protein BDW47DRAFT_101036 [Aspergillus candidus]PLB40395.1 hypothetical protein BDW47DRAFT_101036 [Aspergillus candidus]